MENPIKMDNLGVPLFSETSIVVIDPETRGRCLLAVLGIQVCSLEIKIRGDIRRTPWKSNI